MTTPNLPLQPPRDFENITFREILSAVRTGENGGPAPGPTGPVLPVTVPLPILDGSGRKTLFRQPLAATDYGFARPWFDARAPSLRPYSNCPGCVRKWIRASTRMAALPARLCSGA